MTTVVNKYKSKFDVYIGRPSIFGNPYAIGKDGTRDEVIEKYFHYFNNRIINDPIFLEEVLKLKDKILGCFCSPQKCHGDIIVNFLNNLE